MSICLSNISKENSPIEPSPNIDDSGNHATKRRRWQVPREDGGGLCVPPFENGRQLAADNRGYLDELKETVQIHGVPLSTLRIMARSAILAAASDYTTTLRGEPVEPPAVAMTARWYVTGHQPELFHPGVWIKNAAIGLLATGTSEDPLSSAEQGIGLNLIVDNDLHTTSSLSFPQGPMESVSIESIPYDQPSRPQPWEEREVMEEALFRRCGATVAEAIESKWGYRPLIADCWDDASQHLTTSRRLVDCFATMRHRQERRCGIHNFELPLSQVCETEPFRHFVAHLMLHGARFAQVHNAALENYRRVNHLRSQAHPVPPLEVRGDWIEAPFWIWQAGDRTRQRLFVRISQASIDFGNGDRLLGSAPRQHSTDLRPTDSPPRIDSPNTELIAALVAFSASGWRLRTRALTTTLFTRLCLADLFIHGIGGAKYDELTDAICLKFFHVSLPDFMTLTATRHLPLPAFDTTPAMLNQKQQQLRQLRFQGERFLPPDLVPELREHFSTLLDQWNRDHAARRSQQSPHVVTPMLSPAARRELHQELVAVQQQFADLAAPKATLLRHDLRQREQEVQSNRILQSREHPWPLHPATLFESLKSLPLSGE